MKQLIILICLVFSLFSSSYGETREILRYAEDCLVGVESTGRQPEVYVIRYTSRRMLADGVLDTDLYTEIPERGYAVLFHSYVSGDPFSDSYAFFLDESGKLMLSFDYEECHDLYEQYYSKFSPYNVTAGEIALMYLDNCNYISHMINFASDSGEALKGKLEVNTWYSLSEKQIEKIR